MMRHRRSGGSGGGSSEDLTAKCGCGASSETDGPSKVVMRAASAGGAAWKRERECGRGADSLTAHNRTATAASAGVEQREEAGGTAPARAAASHEAEPTMRALTNWSGGCSRLQRCQEARVIFKLRRSFCCGRRHSAHTLRLFFHRRGRWCVPLAATARLLRRGTTAAPFLVALAAALSRTASFFVMERLQLASAAFASFLPAGQHSVSSAQFACSPRTSITFTVRHASFSIRTSTPAVNRRPPTRFVVTASSSEPPSAQNENAARLGDESDSSQPQLSTPHNASAPPPGASALSNEQLQSSNQVESSVQSGGSGGESEQRSSNILAGWFTWSLASLKRLFAPGGFVWGVATGVSLSVAFLFFQWSADGDSLLKEKVTLFDFILQDINSSYVEKVDINRLFETGVNSMLGTLDPYTQFENNAQAAEMSLKTSGRYAGVGLGITLDDQVGKAVKDKKVVVVSAFEGYAFDAGVRPGDVIEAVAGQPISGLSLEKVTEMLRGEPGTTVSVTVRREGAQEPLTFSLARQSVRIKDVPAFGFVGNPSDRIGYIRLQSFAKDAAAEVKLAVQTLGRSVSKGNPNLNGLVLDLRGNPGGLLNAAIEVSELFLPQDSVIVSTKGRGLAPNPTYVSSKRPIIPSSMPLVVLVNGQTASASEIVAGAVQDLDRGIIVGSKSFGKGLVQNVQELPFNTALKYTVGKYYTPSGRCIQSVNYEQAEGDGPFEMRKVEETERAEFKTNRGRTVRDGGGIEPDVEVVRRPSFLEQALLRQNMYFRFANRFGAQTRMEKLPASFIVEDKVYKDFVSFVTNSEFKYESRFDDAFEQLDNMFDEVGYQEARSKVTDLKTATKLEMKSDFIRHEKAIKNQIESAIRFRFQPDSERIIAELKNDDQLAEAVRLIKNKGDYERLLADPRVEGQGFEHVAASNTALVT
ncbi:Peptidase S41 [Gracilaria domingensis]|nr:Peptidase S41 [Gracilaria domingensis]